MKITIIYSYEDQHGKLCKADLAIAEECKKISPDVRFIKYDQIMDTEFSDDEVAINAADSFEDCREEAKIPIMLKMKNVAYTGNDAETMLISNNKYAAKSVLSALGVSTPAFQVFQSGEEILKEMKFPLIIKPVQQDASEGIDEDSVVFDEEELRKKVKQVISTWKQPALAEEYIGGREFCVPVMGNDKTQTLPILEIDYSEEYFLNKPKFLTYKAKWSKNSNDFKNTYSMVAQNVEEFLKLKLERTAKKAYEVMKCRGYATVDMRVDELGNVYVLEVNPNCYTAVDSDVAKSARASGLEYHEFMRKVLELALERKEQLVVVRN